MCGCHSQSSVAQYPEERSASSEDTHPLPSPARCSTAMPHRESLVVHRDPCSGFLLQQWDLKSSQPYLKPIREHRLGKASFALTGQDCG